MNKKNMNQNKRRHPDVRECIVVLDLLDSSSLRNVGGDANICHLILNESMSDNETNKRQEGERQKEKDGDQDNNL
ncbi:hypothetical protein BLOT_008052 [Blomia tropicalis]|nr:hypothetical protein BLOT_008052 [Blomia tropicalis]